MLTAASFLAAGLMVGQTQADVFKVDFNGDGYENMLVGIPDEDIVTRINTGEEKSFIDKPMAPLVRNQRPLIYIRPEMECLVSIYSVLPKQIIVLVLASPLGILIRMVRMI